MRYWKSSASKLYPNNNILVVKGFKYEKHYVYKKKDCKFHIYMYCIKRADWCIWAYIWLFANIHILTLWVPAVLSVLCLGMVEVEAAIIAASTSTIPSHWAVATFRQRLRFIPYQSLAICIYIFMYVYIADFQNVYTHSWYSEG